MSNGRVLHVLRQMNPGGVERWLMDVVRLQGRTSFDFAVETDAPGLFDAEVIERGGRIFRGGVTEALRAGGPFRAVHSHVHCASGFALRAARVAGVPVRVAHAHCGVLPVDERPSLVRRLYRTVARRLIARNATRGLAVSDAARRGLFEGLPTPVEILLPGLDLSVYKRPVDRERVRRSLGIEADVRLAVHVGCFRAGKNHRFLVETFAAAVARNPSARLLLVGDGSLRMEIEARVKAAGIREPTIFAGSRSDIRDLLGASDVFLFPSLSEGLGLASVEAQAAGLPCVVSTGVPPEATLIEENTRRLPLSAGVAAWAEALLSMQSRVPRGASAERAVRSPFHIACSARRLEEIYADRA